MVVDMERSLESLPCGHDGYSSQEEIGAFAEDEVTVLDLVEG